MTKVEEKIRISVHQTENGSGRLIGFVEQQLGGHWRAWDGVISWGPIETKELAISAVRANHEAAETESEMRRQRRGWRS